MAQNPATPILTAFPPPSSHVYGLQGIAYDQLTEREKLKPGLQMGPHDVWYHMQMDRRSSTAPLSGDCEDAGKGKSSQGAGIPARYLTVHYVWRDRWP